MSSPDSPVSCVPPKRFWGKVSPAGWHPLLAHAADVAAVMRCLLAPDSASGHRLAALTGLAELTPELRSRLVFLAACHDLGKVNHGFQAKVRAGESATRWPALGHAGPCLNSIAVVPPLRDLVLKTIVGYLGTPTREAAALVGVALAHHGRPLPMDQSDPALGCLWQPPRAQRDPLAEARRIVGCAARWAELTDTAPPALPTDPAFSHLYAGLLQLADWIGSTASAFPFAPWADDDPDGYWARAALPRAADACAGIGLVPRTRPVALAGLPLLARLFPATFAEGRATPTPLQAHVAAMPLPEPGARLLIESETGSGKTEAALTLYCRLRAAGLVGGLFFALPTRATASAMHERVRAALEGLYEGPERPSLALAAGGQQPRGEATGALAEGSNRDDDPTDADLSRWASNHHKAYLAAEIVVGTVDQALLAALPVKHAHLRLAALTRHLLVVDELHSYDRYLTSLLQHLLKLHSAAGGLALFMSATLSHIACRTLGGGAELDFEHAVARPYPNFSVCATPGVGWSDLGLPSISPPKEVAWRCVDESAALAEAVTAAQAGARVLFVRNTIKAARAAVQALCDQGQAELLWRPDDSPHRPPYHARYAQPDRLALDEDIRRRFGKDAATAAGGSIVVSTQVAEQSLDVDFDLLLTDLCPIDVLLQRLGRVHRHAARHDYRPAGWRSPTPVLVVAPDGGFATRLKARSVEVGWGESAPYDDYRVAELTWRLLRDRPDVCIPEHNRELVEAVYHPSRWEELADEPAWQQYAQGPELREARRRFVATACAINFDVRYSDVKCVQQFANELGVEYRTRLGDDTIRLDLPTPVRCWYADAEVQHADLPIWALPKDGNGEPLQTAIPQPDRDGASCWRLGPRLLWYSPAGWEWQEE